MAMRIRADRLEEYRQSFYVASKPKAADDTSHSDDGAKDSTTNPK
jgi:hypothetical protein